jgi:hypothetical protein
MQHDLLASCGHQIDDWLSLRYIEQAIHSLPRSSAAARLIGFAAGVNIVSSLGTQSIRSFDRGLRNNLDQN